jgi:ectoine hydroxylase-related dioxygenase (phytanoyl-CoA dioxygenase family)
MPLGSTVDGADRRFFEEHGWLIVRGAVDPARVARLAAALDELIPEASYVAWGGRVVELAGISHRSPEIAAHVRDPDIARLAADALGARGVRLLQDTALIKPVAVPARVEWHQDHSYLAYLDRPAVVTVRVALTRCSLESGCMRVIDASHTWGLLGDNLAFRRDRVEDALEALSPELRARARAAEVPLELAPGDLSLHHCLTFHGSEENRGAHPRKTLAVRIADAECRLVPSRLPSAEMAPHFPTDADGRLTGASFPLLWSDGSGDGDG